MITLIRDGIVMGVATELQASVFERSGYVRIEKPVAKVAAGKPKDVDVPEKVIEEIPKEASADVSEEAVADDKPRRRRRAKKPE